MHKLPVVGILVLAALSWACDSGNPVLPTDPAAPGAGGAESYVLTISANPAQAPIGQTVTVTVSVRHDGGDGSAPTGTVVINTNLGAFVEAGGGNPVQTKELTLRPGGGASSSASTAFQAGDKTGTANLLARYGGFTGSFNLAIVEPGVAPKASFSVQVSGLQAIFTDTSTGNPDTWRWDFGDPGSGAANTSTAQNPVHTFSKAGSFTVTLTVSKSAEPGQTSSASQFVAASASVTAKFEAQDQGLQVNFTDTSTGSPDTWEWSFGDSGSGAANRSTQQNPVHSYSQAGTYTVTLTVSRSANPNDRSSTSKSITVARGLAADFSFDVEAFTVTFTDMSAGNPTSWRWNFGDGSAVNTQQHPSHAYASPGGTFTVTLTVDNAADPASTIRKQVTVPPAGSRPQANFQFEVTGLTANFTDTSSGNPTSWQWDFGDGSAMSTQQNPSHTYQQPGSYQVTLMVGNASGQSSASRAVTVSDPLRASFTVNVNGLQAAFTDTSQGNPTTWSWDFGDGAVSSAQNPAHPYATAGTYTATLTVTDAAGGSDMTSQLVRVGQPPTANFTFTTNSLTAFFSDTSQNGPTSWSWSFGDPASGSGNTSTQQNPSHTFSTGGSFSVRLTATNDFGSSSVTKAVMVTLPPPTASFTYTTNGLMVSFMDTSTQNPTSWLWDFGDGNTSTMQNPTNTYTCNVASCTFNVTLTATNSAGSGMVTQMVTVTVP